MNKTDLTISLLRYRMTRSAARLGFSAGEAALMSEQRLKNEGLFGFLRKFKAAGTPEGAIVAIVETFWRAVIQQTQANPAIVRLEDGPEKQAMLEQFRKNALAAIEQHRKRFYGGSAHFPEDLSEFVTYRLQTEIPKNHGMAADQMGLDRETIHHMVDQCNEYFRARIDDLRAAA